MLDTGMCSQLHVTHLANTLWKFKQENLFCDTTIVAQNGIEILAHSAVLGAVSVKLKIALQGQCGKYQLYLTDCEPCWLNIVLRYIYTGVAEDLNQLSGDDASHLSSVYEKLGISCVQFPTAVYDETQDAANSKNGHSQEAGQNVSTAEQHFRSSENGVKQMPDDDLGNSIINSCNADTTTLSKEIALLWQVRTTLGMEPRCKNAEPELGTNSEKTIEGSSFVTSDDNTEKSLNERRGRAKVPQKTVLVLTKPLNTLKATGIKYKNIVGSNVGELTDIKDIVVKTEAAEQSCTALDAVDSTALKPLMRRRRNGSKTGASRMRTALSFQCQLCSKHFTRKAHLLDHLRLHTTTKPYVCVLCHKTFTQGSHLRRHYVVRCSENRTETSTSGKGSTTNVMLSAHEEIHDMDHSFICNICQKGFAGEAQLKRHSATHTSEHRFQCQKCSKSFIRRAHLLKHEMTHNDAWAVKCSICNKGFHTATELEEHNGMHTGILPQVCHVCGKRFALLETLKRHESVHLAKKTFQCKKCDKSFKCLSYLKSHQKWHDGIKPFMCDICGKGFLGSSNLKTHRRIHTGERPYKCSHCDKSFLQICAVKEHEKIHLGEKQFVCDTCGKMFMTYAQLYNHLKIHIGIKAFECEICKKRFFTNGDMTKHQRIHKDQRPFVCKVCGKGFKYSSNLHGHARIHSGDRPYQCKTCQKAFTYSSHLSRHNKLHMREKIISEEKECEPLSVTLLNNQVPVSHTPFYPVYIDGHSVSTNLQPAFPVYTGFDINLSSI